MKREKLLDLLYYYMQSNSLKWEIGEKEVSLPDRIFSPP